MISEIKKSLYYLYKLSFRTVLIFWLVYLGIMGLFMILAVTAGGGIEFFGVNSLPSLIFMCIHGVIFFKDGFPFVIKYGVSRQGFLSTLFVFSIILSSIMTGLSYLFVRLINWIVELFSIENFDFVALDMGEYVTLTDHNPIFFEWLLHLSLFILFMFVASVLYRFGLKIGGLLLIIFPISMFIRPIAEKVLDLLTYFALFHDNYTPLSFLILIVGLSLLLWFSVKKASVVDQISFKA